MNSKYLMSALALIFGVVTNVGATQLNQHGANFTPRSSADAAFIAHGPYGVSNNAATPKQVIASVDHNPSTTGETIHVFGSHNGIQTTSLCAYSVNSSGLPLASTCSPAAGVAGAWVRTLSFTAPQTPPGSFLSLVATLPANGNGRIIGLSVSP
jgi:hypothetical protein